jgi:hypothetical protein
MIVKPWIPFDADEQEIEELYVIRDGIPATLKPALLSWIIDRLPLVPYSNGHTTPQAIHMLQAALRIDFGLGAKETLVREELVELLDAMGDRTVIRTVDFMASAFSYDSRYGYIPPEIEELTLHFDLASSAFEIHRTEDLDYRIRRRLPEGVEASIQEAINLQPMAGRHLANSWKSAFALDPNESFAMSEAIRAVEAASGPVVIPKDRKPTLGKVVNAIRDQEGWTLVLSANDGYPDHKDVLVGMLETLAKAQTDRHSGDKPTPLEAQAHAQLAATLVHWFSAGAVIRRTS